MGNASERRIERIKSLLLQVVSEVIREELADPRIGIHSLTGATISRDLSQARITVATVGGEEASRITCEVLNRAEPLLWNRVRSETDLRTIPHLRFVPEQGIDHSSRIFTLLEELRQDANLEAETSNDTGDVDETETMEENEVKGARQ
jgi:ribosome-binding factor A